MRIRYTVRQLKKNSSYLGLALPGVLLLTAFGLAPILFTFLVSFTRWTVIGQPEYIGLFNYQHLLNDWFFIRAFKNTLYYTVILTPSITVLSFTLALILRHLKRGQNIFKAIYLFPMITALSCTSAIWKGMLQPFGLINQVLTALGLNPVQFLSAELVIPSLCMVLIWRDIGYYALFFLAGLEAIPKELIEAAMVDGAGPIARFRSVIWPLMKPVTFLVASLVTIGSFMIFTIVYMITGGGPVYSSQALLNYIYETGWQNFQMGYAAAASVYYFFVLLLLNLTQRLVLKHD